MLEQIERPFDKKIYSMCLFMINNGQKIGTTVNGKSENSLEYFPVMNVLVKETMSKNYMKEIVTGILIPVTYTSKGLDELNFRLSETNLCPVHIKANVSLKNERKEISYCDSYGWFDGEIDEYFFHKKEDCVVNNNQLKRYLKIHKNEEQYAKELLDMFQEGNCRYHNMFDSCQIGESRAIKKVLKRGYRK